MSLSESALKTLCKDEVIALPLEDQNNFDSALANIDEEISYPRVRKWDNYEKMKS